MMMILRKKDFGVLLLIHLVYKYLIHLLLSFIVLFHFFLNLISAFLIIKTKAQQCTIVQSEQTYNQTLHNQFRQYRHLIIAPFNVSFQFEIHGYF